MTIPLDFQLKRLGVPVTKENWKGPLAASSEGVFDGGFYQRGIKKKERTET